MAGGCGAAPLQKKEGREKKQGGLPEMTWFSFFLLRIIKFAHEQNIFCAVTQCQKCHQQPAMPRTKISVPGSAPEHPRLDRPVLAGPARAKQDRKDMEAKLKKAAKRAAVDAAGPGSAPMTKKPRKQAARLQGTVLQRVCKPAARGAGVVSLIC